MDGPLPKAKQISSLPRYATGGSMAVLFLSLTFFDKHFSFIWLGLSFITAIATLAAVRLLSSRRNNIEVHNRAKNIQAVITEPLQLLHYAPDPIIVLDQNGDILFSNAAAEKLSGYTSAELLQQPITLLIPEQFRASHLGGFNRYLKNKVKTRDWSAMDTIIRRKDGSELRTELSFSAQEIEGGTTFTGIFRDISSKKQKEDTIHENERRFRSLIERSEDVFCLCEVNGIISYISPSVTKLLGYDPIEVTGKDSIGFFHPNDQLIAMELLAKMIDDPSYQPTAQLRLRHKNGEYRWVEIESQNSIADPAINALVAIFRDITPLKEAHEELDRFFNLSQDLFCTLTTEGVFEKTNAAFSHVLGYLPSELKGRQLLDFIYEADKSIVSDALKMLRSGEPFVSFDCRVNCHSDNYRWLSWNSSNVSSSGHIYGAARDVTAAKATETELKNKSEQYSLLFFSNPVPMLIYDTNSLRILSANDSFVRSYGYHKDEVSQLSILDLIPEPTRPTRQQMREKLETKLGTIQSSSWQYQRKDGSVIDVEITSDTIYFHDREARLVSAFDITARKQAEMARQQSEANLMAILENTDEAIWSIDTKFQLVTGNTAFRKIFKDIFSFPVEELAQHSDKISTSMKSLFFEQFNQAMEGKRLAVERTVTVKGKKKNFEIHINPIVFEGNIIGVSCFARETTERKYLEEALKNIATGISSATGEEFFRSLVNYLSNHLNADFVMVGEIIGERRDRIQTVAVSHQGESAENMEYLLEGSPAGEVVWQGMQTFTDKVQELFPKDSFLRQLSLECYIGIPLYDIHNNPIGVLEVIHRAPISNIRMAEYIMQIFASRAAAELERKHAEEEVRQSEANLNALIQNAQEAIWAVDKDYKVIVANDAFKKLFSYYYGAIPEKGMRMYEHFSPKAKEAWMQRFNRAMNGERFILERRYDLGDEYMDTEVSINPIIRENGSITGVSYFSRDITPRKRAEEVIRMSEAKYRTLVETMKEGLMYQDADDTIQFVNYRFCEMLGYQEEELLGKTCEVFLKDDETIDRVREHMELRRKGFSSHYEAQFVKKDGSSFWVLVNGTPLVTEENTYLGAMATITDISDLKKTEDDLKAINQDLNTFIYKSSHDLKGPLSSIMGLTQLAQKEVKDKTGLMYVEMIRQGATRLDNILSDLLDTIKIKEGILSTDEIDFKEMLGDIVQSLSHSPGYERIDFKQDLNQTKAFYTDKNILRSILQNLIDNAIKYQDYNKPNSYIWVSVSDEDNGVKITVEDNGLGILKVAQDKIFDMFFRAHLTSKGTGLGLYIVKNAVVKLGGNIIFESEEGQGTKFTLTLPNRMTETSNVVNATQEAS